MDLGGVGGRVRRTLDQHTLNKVLPDLKIEYMSNIIDAQLNNMVEGIPRPNPRHSEHR